jgi:hypothetical protein
MPLKHNELRKNGYCLQKLREIPKKLQDPKASVQSDQEAQHCTWHNSIFDVEVRVLGGIVGPFVGILPPHHVHREARQANEKHLHHGEVQAIKWSHKQVLIMAWKSKSPIKLSGSLAWGLTRYRETKTIRNNSCVLSEMPAVTPVSSPIEPLNGDSSADSTHLQRSWKL